MPKESFRIMAATSLNRINTGLGKIGHTFDSITTTQTGDRKRLNLLGAAIYATLFLSPYIAGVVYGALNNDYPRGVLGGIALEIAAVILVGFGAKIAESRKRGKVSVSSTE